MLAKSTTTCPVGYDHAEVSGKQYFVFFDRERVWLRCSSGFAHLLGYKPEELVGGTADKLLPAGFEYNQQIWEQFLAQGEIRRFIPLETSSGKKFGAWIGYQLLRDGCMVAIIEPLSQSSDQTHEAVRRV